MPPTFDASEFRSRRAAPLPEAASASSGDPHWAAALAELEAEIPLLAPDRLGPTPAPHAPVRVSTVRASPGLVPSGAVGLVDGTGAHPPRLRELGEAVRHTLHASWVAAVRLTRPGYGVLGMAWVAALVMAAGGPGGPAAFGWPAVTELVVRLVQLLGMSTALVWFLHGALHTLAAVQRPERYQRLAEHLLAAPAAFALWQLLEYVAREGTPQLASWLQHP